MSKRKTLHLKARRTLPELNVGEDPLAELLDQPSKVDPHMATRPNPRKRPARLMPYSMKAHPEQEGVTSLVRAAGVATDHDWEKLAEKNSGKMLRYALERLHDGPRLWELIRGAAAASGQTISASALPINQILKRNSL